MLPKKVHLLISYILVLCPFVDNFRTTTRDIARDLRLSAIVARGVFEYLGCKFLKAGTAELLVPLKLPEPRRWRRDESQSSWCW
ncbi:hypothetical protein CDL15_Pgr020381 [Punica granatum]|nr:hypothetical protein CDL15_Pgr020381 [Punica granatum]